MMIIAAIIWIEPVVELYLRFALIVTALAIGFAVYAIAQVVRR